MGKMEVGKMAEKELRFMDLNVASMTEDDKEEEMIVEGYAVTFDSPTVLYSYEGIDYYEVIDRNALDNADLTDVPFKYNHSDNVMIMARTRNKTLELMKDDKGLKIRASIAPTQAGKDLYTLIKRGDVDKMSFAFTVEEDSYNRDTHTRTIKKIKRLYDVAAVDIPAYDSTSISARSYFELEREKEQMLESMKEKEALELKRKQLSLRLSL